MSIASKIFTSIAKAAFSAAVKPAAKAATSTAAKAAVKTAAAKTVAKAIAPISKLPPVSGVQHVVGHQRIMPSGKVELVKPHERHTPISAHMTAPPATAAPVSPAPVSPPAPKPDGLDTAVKLGTGADILSAIASIFAH